MSNILPGAVASYWLIDIAEARALIAEIPADKRTQDHETIARLLDSTLRSMARNLVQDAEVVGHVIKDAA